MSEITVTPATRREVWLSIALAVAHNGLPEPERLTFHRWVDHTRPDGEGREYRVLHIICDSHTAALAWMRWLGVEDSASRHDRADLGIRYLTSSDHVRTIRDGWVWNISGEEPLPTPAAEKLAAEVAAAVLTPDAGPAEEPRCPGCDEPLALIASGAVGHASDACDPQNAEPAAAEEPESGGELPAHHEKSGRINDRGETVLTCACSRTFAGSTPDVARAALAEHATQRAGRP
jgi:hypothetical protein